VGARLLGADGTLLWERWQPGHEPARTASRSIGYDWSAAMPLRHDKIRDKAEFYAAGKRDSSLEVTFEPPPGAETTRGAPEPSSKDLSVTRVVQRDERFEYLRDALAQLSPEHRQAITLVFFEGLSLREAGERMGGRTEDALRMLLRRAEGRLGEILKRSYGEP